MVKLLIIADDFTGALDTGVQFAASGASTRVVTNSQYDITQIEESIEVLVMDAETRHLSAEDAYDVVYTIVKKACAIPIPYLYKKTDSTLRGNIGSELGAALEAAGGWNLHFLPAFPKMKRITKQGIHYIEDIPIHKSVFAQDPYEPVICSDVAEIIHKQTKVQVQTIRKGEQRRPWDQPVIWVYDAETEADVEEIAEKLYHENQLHLLAGCAGFAAVLPKLLSLNGGKPKMPEFSAKFLVVCGSVNPITQAQLNYAEAHGFVRIRFTPEQKLLEGYFETVQGCETLRRWNEICQHHARCILDTNDSQEQPDTPEYAKTAGILPEEMRMRISTNLGSAIKKLIKMGVDSTLLITGGDSLLAFMNQIAVYEIIPICELAPGAVLSQFQIEGKTYEVISKSGGFGEENLMELLADEILEKKRR